MLNSAVPHSVQPLALLLAACGWIIGLNCGQKGEALHSKVLIMLLGLCFRDYKYNANLGHVWRFYLLSPRFWFGQ